MSHSACQNCEWRGPDEDLREVKDLTQRVSAGEPMPSGTCPECGSLCQPTADDGTTQRVRVTADCTADLQEIWEGNAPAYLAGDELCDWCHEQLMSGDSSLTFESQEVSGEQGRTIVDVEVLPDDAPASDASNATPFDDLKGEVKAALEGDSNDAEHDALVAVAEHFGIDYTPIDYLAGEEPSTWTFCGHWENDEIVVEYVLPGAVEDPRIDVGAHEQGLWAASGSGATVEEAQAAAIAEYEAEVR